MVGLFTVILGILAAAYCGLILVYRYWFRRLKIYEPIRPQPSATYFSIIIPARDEAENISACLNTILQQNYPVAFTEVLVVNDYSTDDTAAIVAEFSLKYPFIRLINLADHLDGKVINAYKKRAIEIAVAQSKGNWMVTTDADCLLPVDWLFLLDQYIQEKNPMLVAAPVMFTQLKSVIGIFQSLDFISLQGITAAAVAAGYHSMCNGANLAYEKKAFYAVGQFKGIDHLASGDDMFLMHKIKQQYPARLGYLFSPKVIVETAPMPNWNAFLQQRIRWASKADSYTEKSIFWVLALVYSFNAALLLGVLVAFFTEGLWYWVLYFIGIKTLVELLFMLPVARFYGLQQTLLYFPLLQPLHIFYTVIAGWLGKFGKYRWKNRTVQ
ncbi:MAG: glycosyltransferase [Sphingobacteriia bacterium]|nr:MAG: glycosyltransferase [Sphingobacteriia bacterium]TAG29493.1 MAG: glycosyltransferase [Sphingobacteriia bacterium]